MLATAEKRYSLICQKLTKRLVFLCARHANTKFYTQNVEDTVLGGDREGVGRSIGARVREIITENLREPDRTGENRSSEQAMARSLQVKCLPDLAAPSSYSNTIASYYVGARLSS